MNAVRRVLVVDDDSFMRALVERVFSNAGIAVESYGSASDLLAAANLSEPVVLLLDVKMPGMSGLDLQALLRDRGIKAPVVFLSGSGDLKMAVAAMRDGAADFLEKPFENEDLIERVQRAFSRIAARAVPAAGDARPDYLSRRDTLTRRERQVNDLMLTGKTSKVIARELGGSFRTIEIHRASVMSKMAAANLAELVRMSFVVETPE